VSDANTYSCVVSPEDGRPSCTLSHCTPGRPEEDKIDFGLAKMAVEGPEALPQVPAESNRSEKSSERKDIARSAHSGPLPYNAETNTYTCPAYNPNGRFCAGGHGVPVIIRYNNGIGRAGSCSNNLVGMPPLGNAYSPCWETSPISGDAACSKK
jgi:hypothetical protein